MQSYRAGRHFFEPIPADSDLIAFIETHCRHQSIQTALFGFIGMVRLATIGVYDPKQQVYVTHVEQKATEVISCMGHIMEKDATPHITAKIVLADTQGNITGGHLFPKTIIANGELSIKELIPLRP